MIKPKDIVLSYLGKSFTKHVFTFFADLFVIDVGLKPSFLLDYVSTDFHKVDLAIVTLHKNGYLKNRLRVLQVDNFEIFIFNTTHLLQHLEEVRGNMCLFINVSTSAKTPRVLHSSTSNELVDNIFSCLDAVMSTASTGALDDPLQINPHNSVNRTTLYGILLGYPIIYWYETKEEAMEKGETDTCLSLVPIRVHKLTAQFKKSSQKPFSDILDILNGRKCVVYSFSHPVDCTVVKSNLQKWKIQLNYLVEPLVDISLHHEVNDTCMETIVL